MYKLLLVDDEADVREGLMQEINWGEEGFEVVGIAENGKEALELIEKYMPDVVVTDIKMPFMDGMQLSEAVRKQYPTTKIIILTGFDEFEYAQKAIKLHIDEYVLKPFSAQDLLQAIDKVKEKIAEEIAEKENIHALQEHYRESLPVLREVFLASLINRVLPESEIREKASNYQIDLDGKHYLLCTISMDHPGEHARFSLTKEKELLLFAILNITEEVISRDHRAIVFIHQDRVVILMIFNEGKQQDLLVNTLPVLEEIRLSVEKYLRHTVTVGVGTLCRELTEIPYSYEGSISALDYRLILGNNRVICIDDVEERSEDQLRFDELKEQALIRCLKVGTLSELKEIVEELCSDIAHAHVSIKDCQIYLLEILTTILKVAKSANLNVDEILGSSVHLFAEINKFHTLREASDWIIGVCTKIMNSIANERQSSYKHLVEKAIAYTKEHFHESDISINKVCSHLHISTGYFSSIFKKETKMTFVSYLMQIRMEAAKEYLRTTDLKAFEIAEKVGYADPNYFSFSFRKMCGMSPKEYKNSARGD